MVKKVIANLDLSKASGPDCIPVVVLRNCDPELSYILPELFIKCLKESCFVDCWKVSLKTTNLLSLLSVVSKVFEKVILSVIRHLICGNNLNWFVNLNLIYMTLGTGARKGLLISVLKKPNWFCLTCLKTLVLLM